jgi:hypothetical protein
MATTEIHGFTIHHAVNVVLTDPGNIQHLVFPAHLLYLFCVKINGTCYPNRATTMVPRFPLTLLKSKSLRILWLIMSSLGITC